MRKLIIQQDESNYAGFFSSPAFQLWGGGAVIIEGLYKAFSDYNVGLDSISLDYSSSDSSSQGVKVDLGDLGDYKFGFEQVEWSMNNIDKDDLVQIPEVLRHGEKWLRSIIPDFSFKIHVFNYFNHATLSEGTSREFLLSFSNIDIPGIGESIGSGLIFHWELPEQGWRMNLTVDHSNVISDGLFLDQEIIAQSDQIDYGKMIVESRGLLKDVVAKIGFELQEEAE